MCVILFYKRKTKKGNIVVVVVVDVIVLNKYTNTCSHYFNVIITITYKKRNLIVRRVNVEKKNVTNFIIYVF